MSDQGEYEGGESWGQRKRRPETEIIGRRKEARLKTKSKRILGGGASFQRRGEPTSGKDKPIFNKQT